MITTDHSIDYVTCLHSQIAVLRDKPKKTQKDEKQQYTTLHWKGNTNKYSSTIHYLPGRFPACYAIYGVRYMKT